MQVLGHKIWRKEYQPRFPPAPLTACSRFVKYPATLWSNWYSDALKKGGVCPPRLSGSHKKRSLESFFWSRNRQKGRKSPTIFLSWFFSHWEIWDSCSTKKGRWKTFGMRLTGFSIAGLWRIYSVWSITPRRSNTLGSGCDWLLCNLIKCIQKYSVSVKTINFNSNPDKNRNLRFFQSTAVDREFCDARTCNGSQSGSRFSW